MISRPDSPTRQFANVAQDTADRLGLLPSRTSGIDSSPHREAPAEMQAPPALLTKELILRFYLPIGERTLDRWTASGRFPRPDIAMGGKARLWKRETVEAWVEAQVAASRR